MRLYLTQRAYSLTSRFSVKDEYGNHKYYAKGKFFSLGCKLRIIEENRREVAMINRRLLRLRPTFVISKDGAQIAEVIKHFSLRRPKYTISGLDWKIVGDILSHNYRILQGNVTVAVIKKEWFRWGNTYMIEIKGSHDPLPIVAVALVIDCVLASRYKTGAAI